MFERQIKSMDIEMDVNSRNVLDSNFTLRRSHFSELVKRLKRSLFKRLTKNAMPIFFRANDIISTWPLANGEYEPDVTELIRYYAQNKNHSDFFIDVGANIGLTSATVGCWFKEIHMFEPNPECISILNVNAKILLKNYTIHEYGLGLRDSTEVLNIPGDNWGGAFVNEENNSYGATNLIKLSSSVNSTSINVKIKSAEATFVTLFEKFRIGNRKSGVIKIDVEGYESIILEALAKSIPSDIKVLIVFEDLMQTDFSSVMAKFDHRAHLFQVEKDKCLLSSVFKLHKTNPKTHAGSINMVILVE